MTNIKLVATDFDRTLLYKGFPLELLQVFLRIIDKGIFVGICSGRNWWDMQSILSRHGIDFGNPYPQFLICRHSFVYWIHKGKLKEDKEWNEVMIKRIECVTRKMSTYICEWIEKLRQAGYNYTRWTLYHDYGFEVMFASDKEAEEVRQLMTKLVVQIPEVEVTRNYWGINVTVAGIDKGKALKHVADYLDLSPTQILAIGDSLNDMSMLDGRYRFLSAAVVNADEAVKQAVLKNNGVVATKPGGMGVLEILKKFDL